MKICSPQRQQIAKRSPAMQGDGKIISFGIAKNLAHAPWRKRVRSANRSGMPLLAALAHTKSLHEDREKQHD